MKYSIIIVFFTLSTFVSQGQSAKHSTAQLISKKDRKYIPKDLDDCINQIDKFWDDTMKAKAILMTEEEFRGRYHFGLGLWIRNNWGLWKGSRLSKYFNNLGIYHPDDMSGIILASYYRHLKGLEIHLNDQIQQYQNYMKVVQEPSKKSYPAEAPDLQFNRWFDYDTKDSGQGYIQVGTSKKTNTTWIYDYYLGWLKVNERQLHTLDSPLTRETNLQKLFLLKK